MPAKLLTRYTSAMLGPLIASAGSRARLDGADLFALAYALAGVPPRLAIEEALDTLTEHGLPRGAPRAELAERMREATHRDPTFVAFNDRSFCLHRHADLDQRITDSLLRAGLARIRRSTDAATGARPAPRPESRNQAAPRRKEPPRAVGPKPPQRGPLKAEPSPPLPTASASLPPPPPLARAGVSFARLDQAEFARVLAAPRASIAEIVHVLRAHALASAERFEELLALRLMPGVEPHRYQIETVRRVLRFFRGRALLADEVGLGKTVEALMILREYQLRGAVRRALVLVPPALVGQWVGELETKAGIAPRTTEDASFRADPEGFWRGEGVVVASLATARAPRHVGAVQAEPWDVLIVDEAHHVKNRATASFKLVDGIKSRYLLLLTATPIETDLEELYNLVTLLKPGQFATPAAFRAQFVDKKDPLSPKNRERLRGLLAEVMVRNTRADSGLRLPPRYVSTVVVDPLPEERELYDAVVSFLRAYAEDKTARMLATTLLLEAGSSPAAVQGTLRRTGEGDKRTPALRAALIALAGKARAVQATRKAKALVDLLRAHPDQMLVFTRFRDTLDYLERTLREGGIEPLAFHGGLGAEAKRAALDAFRGGAKILLATDVGGEGQNLHHCHVLVNFDLPYNPMLIEQRIGRLHRMGQEEEVRVYNLCARGTAEQRVLDLLDRRLHLFELVVGEMDMVLGNLVDERDLEERIVALYAESRTDAEIERGIDAIEAELATARGRYEQVKSLDSALFGKDYEA